MNMTHQIVNLRFEKQTDTEANLIAIGSLAHVTKTNMVIFSGDPFSFKHI